MNPFQAIVTQAIASGVSSQTIVMFLLLPLVASMVAAIRHLIGFQGVGIFIPTAIALVLTATGLQTGLLLFLSILLAASLGRRLLLKTRLHYLPRMALLLWFVSLVVLALLFASPYLRLGQLATLSIFPVLVLILLAEEFIGIQITKSLREAIRLIMETILVALVGYGIFNVQFLQWLALNQPHWVVFAPLIFNLLIGRFTGLRLLEYRLFKKLLQ